MVPLLDRVHARQRKRQRAVGPGAVDQPGQTAPGRHRNAGRAGGGEDLRDLFGGARAQHRLGRACPSPGAATGIDRILPDEHAAVAEDPPQLFKQLRHRPFVSR
jgi:hypothetical protein